jgi:hypothetical protein
VNDVASVLADVEKVDLDVSMLRDAADVFLNVSDCFRMLRVLFLNVAESHVEPKHQGPMLQICDVECCGGEDDT